jgi:hypothetical protein
MLGKTFAYWKENAGGVILGLLAFIISLFFNLQLPEWKEFIKGIPTICMFIFGSLFTFLAIILQGQSETIDWIKSREKLFSRLVSFHKRIIYLSIVLFCYSYFILFFNFDWIKSFTILNFIPFYNLITKLPIAIFVALSVWFFIDTKCFIGIFYKLLKNDEKK